MNILRLSTLLLALAIAVMTLGYVNSSSAGPKNCVENDPRWGCDPKPGDDGTETFSVDVVAGTGNFNWVVATGDCAGTTTMKLNASFPVGPPCGSTITVQFKDPPGPTGSVVLRLFEIVVRPKKPDVTLKFTSNMTVVEGESISIYRTDRLPWTLGGLSPLTLDIGDTMVELIKPQEPDKGALLGPIAVGTIVYTAQ